MIGWGRRARRAAMPPSMPPLVPLADDIVPARNTEVIPSSIGADEATRPDKRWLLIAAVADAFDDARRQGAELSARAGYPVEAYDLFRRDVPVRPPPPVVGMSPSPILVLIDGLSTEPYLLRATLRSLQDQSHTEWRAVVAASKLIWDHPVGGFATTDARITFVDTLRPVTSATEAYLVVIDSGTMLDPEALAWLDFALRRTGAAAAFSDHDHGIADPARHLLRADPELYGVYDPSLIAANGPPALVAWALHTTPPCPDTRSGEQGRVALLAAAADGAGVAGVPRILATRLALPLAARAGVAEGRATGVETRNSAKPPAPQSHGSITIVIPTRDSPALLMRAIDSLRSNARLPDRLETVVVDNRSQDAATLALFDKLTREQLARVVSLDAPFNWSLASNLGAASGSSPALVFVNDDVELLTHGWDDILLASLDGPDVGAVGARLLYPNGTIQHAGMIFGFGPQGIEHAGRGLRGSDPGPGGLYKKTHNVAAVTGAFMGVRRSYFEQSGGFNAARLMVAHSDIDFCMRLRNRGLVIRYCADIEAIHHEGATRGINRTQSAIAWDEGERADLIARWGAALRDDPGVSPYWQRGDLPFAAYREPGMREILAHIDRSVRPWPWQPIGDDAAGAEFI